MTQQIERIMEMEECLDKAAAAVAAMNSAQGQYAEALPLIEKLEKYYTGKLWREDFDADSAGLLPCDLKRGVLSEDGVYNMLCENSELLKALREFLNTDSDNNN